MISVSDVVPAKVDPAVLGPDQCPWDRYRRTGIQSPWATRLGEDLLVHDAAIVRDILGDARFAQGLRAVMLRNDRLDARFVQRRMAGILLREGEDHARLRRLAARAFTPRASARHRAYMAEVMNGLADDVPDDGVCDAVEVLTHAYPVLVICRVLGAPTEDVELFSRLTEAILNTQGGAPEFLEEGLAAHEHLDAYVRQLVARRRSEPRDDLVTDLIRAEEDRARLTTEEILQVTTSVILAGTDTTRNQLAIALHLFADHPEQWAALERGAVTGAVEEVLRYAPIGHTLTRVATVDVVVRDVLIPAGALVVLHVGAANRDLEFVDEADSFDVRREPIAANLSFGHGRKYCLGASLARAELGEALTVLRSRFPEIALAGPATWRRVGFVQGPTSLPLRLSRPSRSR